MRHLFYRFDRRWASKLLLLGLGFATSLVNLSAQELFGQVTDANDEPIPFATLQLKGVPGGTVADGEGNYKFKDLAAGTYVLRISALGYRFAERTVTLADGVNLRVDPSAQENATALDAVVVSSTLKETSRLDSPLPVEVYGASFFRANPAPSIFESLQNVNGVRPQLNCNVCNTGDIRINGLEGPYTMVLIDGMPIVSGLATVYGLTGIPQALIERIEVVRGPASTLYGSEAVGGLINIITKKVDNAPRFSVDNFTTTWGEVNTDLGLRFGVGDGADALLGINHFYYQNPIDNNDDGFTDLTLQHRISAFNKWNIRRKSNKVFSLAGRYVYEDRWGGEMNWTPADRGGDQVYGESIYTSRWEAFGTYQLPTTEDVFLTFSANGHDQNSVYGDVLYLANQHVYFTQLNWNKSLGDHELVAGLAYRETRYDDNTPATATADGRDNQVSVIRLPGVFVQDEWRFAANHKLLLGLRYDHNSVHGSILSPRLNYQYNSPSRTTTLRLGVGNGYRVANVFTEDHAALTGARDVVFAGELRPETSWNANANLVRQFVLSDGSFLSLDATAFYTRFTNRIIPDYETDPNLIIYDNLDGTATSRGVSLNVEWENTSGLSLLAGATLQDVSLTEDGITQRQLLTEGWSGIWKVSYAFRRLGLSVDYTGNVFGPMRLPLLGELDDRPAQSEVWSIQNIQLTKAIGTRFQLYGGVKNLLNYTPPANSIARAFDPFDRGVEFDAAGQVVPTPENPRALTFDPTYVFAPNQGIRFFLGGRYTIQ